MGAATTHAVLGREHGGPLHPGQTQGLGRKKAASRDLIHHHGSTIINVYPTLSGTQDKKLAALRNRNSYGLGFPQAGPYSRAPSIKQYRQEVSQKNHRQ